MFTIHRITQLTPLSPAGRTSNSEDRWRIAMLVGASLALHGTLVPFAVFMVCSSDPIEDKPLAVELAFAAPAQSATTAVPENAAPRPAKQVEPEPLTSAMSETVPTQPPHEAAEPAAQPLLNQPDAPLPAAVIAPELVSSSPAQTSQSEPEQDRRVTPMPAAAGPSRAPNAVPRPTPKPLPARHPVPRDRVPPFATTSESRLPPSPASSGIPNAPQQSVQLPLPFAKASPTTAQAPSTGVWRGSLAAWVQSRKRYPDEARRRGTEGTVGVRFTVARDGQVLDVQIVQGSGSDLLDQAALAMFRGARAPQFPADMGQQQVSITVTVRYRFAE